MRSAFALVAISMMACSASADSGARSGAEQSEGHVRKVPGELYAGLVLNQTVTVAGYNFYQCFMSAWRDKVASERYVISVHERPSARWGSQIWIEYAQKRIFQASLPTSLLPIRALSEQAAEIAQQKVVDVEVDRLLFREVEFGPDEI